MQACNRQCIDSDAVTSPQDAAMPAAAPGPPAGKVGLIMHRLASNRLTGYLLFLLLFNTAVAAALTLLGNDRHFLNELIYSQAIGLSCGLPAIGVVWLARSTQQLRIGLVLSIAFGVASGASIGALATSYLPHARSINPLQAMGVGLLFAIGAGYYFFTREGTARLEHELELQRARRRELDRSRADMQLRMLQAQIEPHFLFNTLANVSALIRSDPPKAEQLLSHLNAFLRATLQRSRVEASTLADEIDLVRNYLSIIGLRLGTRLLWSIDVPDELLKLSFPMLLLQPLVENAIKHGIEPKRGGGSVTLRAWRDGQCLRIEMADSGVGLAPESGATGFGLMNVRQRLNAHYGQAGQLQLNPNEQGGVTATLEIPI